MDGCPAVLPRRNSSVFQMQLGTWNRDGPPFSLPFIQLLIHSVTSGALHYEGSQIQRKEEEEIKVDCLQ